MKIFEIINVDTNEVLDVVDQTQEYADQANADYRASDIPKRWIEQRPQPDPRCTCGAAERCECVCDLHEAIDEMRDRDDEFPADDDGVDYQG